MTAPPFGVALAVILGAIVIIQARRQIAKFVKRLWTAFAKEFFKE
jgi:hypothetical protein